VALFQRKDGKYQYFEQTLETTGWERKDASGVYVVAEDAKKRHDQLCEAVPTTALRLTDVNQDGYFWRGCHRCQCDDCFGPDCSRPALQIRN
jgi:hypothetical protein